MGPLISGPWSGIPNLLITSIISLIVIAIGAYLCDRIGKQHSSYVFVGLMVGLQIMVSFTSGKFVALTVGGKEFIIIAGSLMYPILACGDDFLNEFYGAKIAKTSVYGQFIARILTTLFLVWLIYLPEPTIKAGNFEMFRNLMGIVPRVAISSIIATYIGGILNVNIFAKIKEKTGAKMLWLRTLVSTLTGLTVNAIVFTFLAFAFTMPVSALFDMVFISVVVRSATGFLELIFLYSMKFLKEKGYILKDLEELIITPKMDNEAV